MPDINALRTRFQAYDDEYNADRARTLAMGGQPIDRSRPIFNNSDGSFSTERTAGFEMDGKYYVIPTIVNGQQLSPDEAMKATIRGENKPVGVFNSQAEGDAYAKSRSNEIGQVRGGEAQSKSGMQSVFLQDKNERLWFPADMKDDEIQKIIERDIYGNKSASDILGDFFKGPKEVLKRAGTEIAQGVGDIASAGAGLSREAQRGVPVIDERLQKVASQENALMGARANMLGKDAPVPAVPPDAAERRAPIMQQQAESYGQTAQALDQFTQGLPKTAEPFYGEDKPVKRFIEDAITGIVRFAPSMVTSAVSPPVGLASTYAQYFGNSYRAKKDKGVKDEVAYSAAMMDTMIGAPMEFGGNIFQIGKFKRSLDAFTKAGKLTGKAAEVFKNIINGALGEGLEEYFQQYPQELGDIYAANADKPAGEISKIVLGTYASKKFQKEALYSAAVGAAGGAALGAVGGAGGLARKGAQLDERGEVGTPSSPGPTIQPPSLADRVAADVAEGRITPEQLKQERANLDDNNPVAQAIDAFFGTQKQQPESRYPGYQDDFRQAEPSPQSVSRTPAERQRLINREMGYEAPPQEPVVPLSELNQRKINNLWDKYEQGAAEGAYESKKDLINEIRTDTREAGELIPNPEIKRLADRIWNMSRRAERNPEIDRLRQRVEGIPQRAAEARTLQWEEVLRTSPVNLEGVNPYASRAGERPESTSRQEGPNREGQGPVHLRDTQENRLETGAREERPATPEQAQPEPEKRPEITLSSTPDAIAFGEKATPEQVSELKRLRKESIAESERLMKTDIQAASDAAAQGQFYREAIEASEGRHPSQKKAETTKLLPPPTQSAFEETPLPTTYLQERGDKALSEGELISPRSPEFKRLRENMATVGEEALAAYRKVYPRGPVVLSQPSMKKYRGQNNGVIIATSTKEPGKFQVTRWDDRGFSGDHQVKTEVDAVKEAYLEGYRIPARQRFETISKTGRFHEGLSKTEQIQREHQSRMAELDKKTEQPPAQVQEPETRPADKIKSAYDALKAERGISNIEIADVRDRAGVSQKDMEDFAKQNKNTILSLGDASVVNAHVKSGGVKVSWDARPHLLMRMGAEEATQSKQVEPEPRKQATERAWVNGQWRPIIEKKEYKRGKNKGKFRVTLASGKTKVVDADGIRGIEQREPVAEKPVEAQKVSKPAVFLPKKNIDKTTTLRGRIQKMGGLRVGNFRSEFKDATTGVKFLLKNSGTSIDLAEQTLRDEGWLRPEENIIDVLRDPANMRRGKVSGEGVEKSERNMTGQEKRVKSEMEYEPEAPPEGDYVTVDAEDLPEGKKLTLIDNKSSRGWDVYEVTEKDPFGVTLKDGITIELKPGDKVEVRKEDLPTKKLIDEDKARVKVKIILNGLKYNLKRDNKGRYVGSQRKLDTLYDDLKFTIKDLRDQGDLDSGTIKLVKESDVYDEKSLKEVLPESFEKPSLVLHGEKQMPKAQAELRTRGKKLGQAEQGGLEFGAPETPSDLTLTGEKVGAKEAAGAEVVNKRLEDEKPNQRTYREFAKAAVIPYAKIDWGRQPRGQGKRAGGMVMGGMSNAPTGVKSYPDFENAEGVTPEAWEEIKLLEDEDKRAAIGALQNGKTFDEAMRMVYAEQDRIKKQPEKIEDFGEKLGGARKDMQPSISREISDDEIATKSFSEIWPKSDVDAIEDNDLAAVAHAVRSEVPAKPRKGYKVARWVEQVKTVRGLMRHAQENGVAAILKKMDESGETLQSFASKIRLLQKIDREQWDRVGSVKYYPKAQSYEGGKLVYSPYAIAEIDNSTVDAKSFDDLVAAVHGKLAVEQAGGTMQFEIRSKRDGSLTFINKKGDPLYRPLKTFKDVKEAREFMRRGKSELVKAWEDLKERENVKETDVRRVENRPRTGKDHRNGKDATPEMFMSAFGFRGVEFGNWVSQGKNAKERQGILNQAYDALMDLSDIIGVPPKALSLNGSLGLGLGSRGHGWASAHFEPDSLVINLTKTRGAGALAHELFHAFDNYFQLKRGKSKTRSREGNYITYQPETYYENTKTGHRLSARRFEEIKYKNGITTPEDWKRIEGVRPEVEEAFADLVKALDASPMNKRSNLIDKGKSGGYWSRVIERAARAFENYINFKMQQNGYQNDYLANVTPASEFARDAGRYPYLLDEEIKPVAEAFDNLFATIKTKETDKGVAMFDRGGRRPAGLTKESIQSATQFATRRWNNGPSISVVQHQHELPTGILSYLKKVGADQDIVRGVFHKDRVYIVADNFTGMPDVFRTLVHESFGHYGIRRMLGPQWPGIMENIYRSHKDAVQAVAKEYGFDTSTEKGRGYAAEEWLSREAETNPKAPIVERVVAAIRRMLRRLGLDMKFTDAEVRDLLVRSREYVQTGRPANIIKAFSNAAFNKHGREQIWYSQMERVLAQKLPGKGNPKAIAGVLDSWARKGEFKQEELEWSGIKEWLDAHPNSIVTKNEVMEWLAANNVQVREVVKGGRNENTVKNDIRALLNRKFENLPNYETAQNYSHEGDWGRLSKLYRELDNLYEGSKAPVYSGYQTPGGENYRELLLTLPDMAVSSGVEIGEAEEGITYRWQGRQVVENCVRYPIIVNGKFEGTITYWPKTFNWKGEEQPGKYVVYTSDIQNAQRDTFKEALATAEDGYLEKAAKNGQFRSTHYQEPNILAHVRFNERTDADGKRVLFIEEIQSDWAQKGRKEGFANSGTAQKEHDAFVESMREEAKRFYFDIAETEGEKETAKKMGEKLSKREDIYSLAKVLGRERDLEARRQAITNERYSVPDAPFVKDTGKWSMLAMKRMVRYAAENGFDRVAWTRGEQQVERYKEALRSVVDEVRWTKTDNGVQLVGLKNGKQVVDTVEKENVVSDAIGKSMGDSILQSPKQSGVFKGDEITISDTGMAGFYDKILPAEVNKFFGKAAWGNARVGETKLNTAIDQHMKELAWLSADAKTDSPYIKTVHSLDITPQMREKAMGGMPLFSKKKPMTYAEQLMAQPEAKQMLKDLATPPDTRGMLKDVRGWAKERFGKGYVDSDMKRLNKVLETPYGLAKKFPSMKAAMETELNAAEKRSKILFHDYNDSGLQAVQEHMQKNKAHLKEMTDLVWKWDGKRFPRSAVPTDALSYPADITEDITINPAHYDEAHAYLIKKGVTPEVADAFVTLRKLYDKKFVEIDKTMRVEDLDAELITQYRGEIGKINNYFPHRRSGDSYVQWIDKSKAGTDEAIVYREHYYSAIDRMRPVNDKAKSRAATWLQAAIARGEVSGTVEDYQLKQGPVKQMPDEVFFQIPVEGMQQVADAAGRELEKSRVMYEAERLFKKGEVASMADGIELAQKRLRKDMSAALSKAIAEVFKPRGWARSAMPRKGIPGHETSDVFGITLDYLSGFAGFKTKIERARAHSGILHSINAKARPEEYRYVSNYIKDMLANQDKTDRAVDTVRGLFFLKYLGFVFKSGIVNLTQNAVMAAPRLSIETKHANTRLAKAMFDVRRALASKEAVAGKEITYANLNANERRMLHEMTEQGVSIDQFLRELKGSIPGKNIYSQALRNFADKSGIFMQLAERFNRASTALAAYRVAVNEKGMDHDKAVDFAKGIVYDSHFVYGKHNLPMWARGGQMRKYLRSAYTFRSFTHNYLNMIHYMALHQGTQGKLAVARSLRNTIAMGGLASFPFIKLLGDAVMWALGRDDEDALTAVREQVPDYLRDVLTYGLPGVAGVDISGSLSLDMPKQWYEILGVPYAAYQDTLNMVESYKSGQTMRSVAESPITPMMVRNAMRGLDLYLYGQHTRSGRALNAPGQVGPRKIDEADLVKKVALGFQPVEISKGYAQYQAVDKAVKLADEKKRYLSNRYVNAMTRNDEEEQRAVIEEVLKWNEEKIAEGKPHLIIDPRQSIRARLAQQPLQRIPRAQRGNALATAGAWQ